MAIWTAVGALAAVASTVVTLWQGDSLPSGDRAADSGQDDGKASEPAPGSGQDDGKTSEPAPKSPKILLRNQHSGLCADVPGTGEVGGPVQQFGCNRKGDKQLWRLKESEADGPNGETLVRIVNVTDGYCMSLPESGKQDPRTPVIEAECGKADNDNQLWWRQEKADGYWIRNAASNGLCLDVMGLTKKTEVPLIIWSCTEKDDQTWKTEEIAST